MRVPLEWLREYVQLPADDADQIAETFVRIGFEVEAVHRVPITTGSLVVGQVRTIEELTGFSKPIRFTTVAVGAGNGPGGSDDPRGIICGASNFAVGDKVVVALPGTVLPGDFAIASRPTYGRISDGMICSARELGIGTEHDGILVLDPDAEIGVDARDLIGANDAVIELAITADRGYALSMRGLARELAAAYDVPFTDPAAVRLRAADGDAHPVIITDPSGCTRFAMVSVSGVNAAAPAPFWMRRRLQAAGIRSISLAVDVTNYVMLEFGQPLHAFDAAKVDGPLTVRRAIADEKVRTLDGVERVLSAEDMVIADASGPVSLAGVMGGESTEISDPTTAVLIEAADWDPVMIARTARRHKLPSEASRRFERFVDPEVGPAAAEAAATLLTEFGGGTVDPGRTDVGGVARPRPVTMRTTEPDRLVGRSFGTGVAAARLAQLGCTVDADVDADGHSVLTVTPPTWRPDLTRPADLVEEVARLEGYDSIPSVLPAAPAGTGLTVARRRQRRIAALLADSGLIEVLAFPFIGQHDLDGLGLDAGDPRRRLVSLVNPLETDRPELATTLLPGLLDTVVRNASRGVTDLAAYSIGQVFQPREGAPATPVLPVTGRPTVAQLADLDASLPAQPVHVAAVLAGAVERPGWWGRGRSASWADAVELARRVAAGAGAEVTVSAAECAPWHPGRCARLRIGNRPIGFAGELHPAVVERFGLPARSAALELDLDALPDQVTPTAPAVSPFPPVHLDLAVVVDAAVPAADVLAALSAGGGDLLESVRLFDVYTGPQVGEGRKSLAFSLVVRSADRTLTAAEATEVRDAALAAAARSAGARLRA